MLNNLKNRLGQIYQSQGEYQKSIMLFSEIIASEPKAAFIYSFRSYSYLQQNKLRLALSDANKSVLISPKNAYIYRNRALIHLALKDTEKACSDLENAITNGYLENIGTDVKELKSKYCTN